MQLEGQLEALGFLGVDGEADAAPGSEARQALQSGQELAEYAGAFRFLKARMQRRELDGNRIGRAYLLDGVRVELHVVRGVGCRARGFAEHVVGMHVRRALGGAADRVLDGLGEHELLGEDAHRLAHCGPHHRLTQAGDDVLERRRRVVPARELAGEQQRPVGGAGEQRSVAARRPVALGKFFPKQRIRGRRVGDAKQSLRHAHECHAFGGRQAVMAQERFGAERSRRCGTHALRETQRAGFDLRAGFGLQGAQPRDRLGFGNAVVAADRRERLGQYNHGLKS